MHFNSNAEWKPWYEQHVERKSIIIKTDSCNKNAQRKQNYADDSSASHRTLEKNIIISFGNSKNDAIEHLKDRSIDGYHKKQAKKDKQDTTLSTAVAVQTTK